MNVKVQLGSLALVVVICLGLASLPSTVSAALGETTNVRLHKGDIEGLKFALANSGFVEEGSGEDIVYVFVDPQCGVSAKFYKYVRTEIDLLSAARVRWIPTYGVGKTKDLVAKGRTQALSILAVGKQALDAAMLQNMPGSASDKGGANMLQLNNALLFSLSNDMGIGDGGVPQFVVVRADGSVFGPGKWNNPDWLLRYLKRQGCDAAAKAKGCSMPL